MSPFAYFATSDILFVLDGDKVDAQIVAPPTVVRSKFSTRYSYCVEYKDANGQHHSGVGLTRDANLKTGDVVSVRYLRSDPTRCRTEFELQHSWPTRVFAMIAFFILAASIGTGVTGVRGILREVSENPIDVPSGSPNNAEP